MVSVIVITHNAPQAARACLESLLACHAALSAGGREIEFVFADDCSVPDRSPVGLFAEFRAQTPWPVKAIRFTRRQHYAAGVARAMSLARGDVLFLSHDMMLTPDCVAELYALSAKLPNFGLYRPCSGHMDWAESVASQPPKLESWDDAARFATEVRVKFSGQVAGWPALIGDAMFIGRQVIERIGVFDHRFWGFWSDLDYGVRIERAGWRHGIALGAWLHHFGAASEHEPKITGGAEVAQNFETTVAESRAAYAIFRQKWGTEHLPETMTDLLAGHFRGLAKVPTPTGGEFQPPLELTPDLAEVL